MHYPFYAPSVCNRLVSSSFHLSQKVLFSFRSRYYYTIGLKSYLGLEVHASQLPTRYPTHGTLDTSNHLSGFPLRGFHPLRLALSLTDSGLPVKMYQGPITPHLPSVSGGIRFALYRFRSPLLAVSLLISFPPPTRMLRFGGFPAITGCHVA